MTNVNSDEIYYLMVIHNLEDKIAELQKINQRYNKIIQNLYKRLEEKESDGNLQNL